MCILGLPNGDVVRARAIVRLVPSSRWDSRLALLRNTTPLTENCKWLDAIEDHEQPHKHRPSEEDVPEQSASRRVRITLQDLQREDVGFTDGCLPHVCVPAG